jgi:RNA polymerase sigma-70 factor (ECF subfamily)
MIDPPDPPRSRTPPRERPDDLTDLLAVVDQHGQRVASVVGRFLDDARDIEEAVQDTFVQAWRHREDFRADSAVFTWLYRIATNNALMRLRRRQLASVPIDDVTGSDVGRLSSDPLAEHPDTMVTIDRVRRALARLPEHHRIVVILRDVEGLSNAETAEILGLPVTTVKAYLHRGRARLRRSLHGHRNPVPRE